MSGTKELSPLKKDIAADIAKKKELNRSAYPIYFIIAFVRMYNCSLLFELVFITNKKKFG